MSDSVIERYRLNCRQCMFRADATDLWSLGEHLNLHASRCNADPAVMFKAQPDPRWSGIEEPDQARACSTLGN